MVSYIKIEGRTVRGAFVERPNRFLALVKVGDKVLRCFLPNPGRMRELLVPGTELVLREVLKEKRKTRYDLFGLFCGGRVVSVDSRLPNRLVLVTLKNGDMKEFADYAVVKPEYGYGNSRFGFFSPVVGRKSVC